jgi:hypothetical protein
MTPVIALALVGAAFAVVAALGKLSGRLGDRVVNGLYYVSYGFTALAIVLFIFRGLLGPAS